MCIRGLMPLPPRTTGPDSDVAERPAATSGITEDERRTIIEMMAAGTDAGGNPATTQS
jgi:hypothetical protein